MTTNEQKTTEENSTTNAGANSIGGHNIKETSIIDRTNAAAKRLEDANKKKEELISREERLHVENKLGGSAEAGIIPAKPKIETPQEYKDRVMRNDL